MNLAEALTLPNKSSIPSVNVNIINKKGTYPLKDNFVSIYNINCTSGFTNSTLRIFHENQTSNLKDNTPYSVQSAITPDGLKGVSVNIYKKDFSIQCDKFAIIKPQKEPMENTVTTQQTVQAIEPPSPPYSVDQLQSYYGKYYVDTLNKMKQVEGVTPEQAHQAALGFLEFVPKAWFGEKLLP